MLPTSEHFLLSRLETLGFLADLEGIDGIDELTAKNIVGMRAEVLRLASTARYVYNIEKILEGARMFARRT